MYLNTMSNGKTKVTIKQRKTPKIRRLEGNGELVNLPFESAGPLYHISDIHIRPLQRHEEFRQVFEQLDTFLSNAEPGLVIITGNIFNNKTLFRPETFKLSRDMLKMIARHMPLIVIAGVNDMTDSMERLDSITPIVEDIPNLYYFKNSGLYYLQKPADHDQMGICFAVSSLYDHGVVRYHSIDRRDGYQYIALYSGRITEDNDGLGLGLGDFEGYDAVLLGDQYKHNILRHDPPMAYAGSLIQQDHEDELDGHGVLVWDQTDSGWVCQHQQIKNSYGFIDILCQDGLWINSNIVLPSHCYARLVIKNCTEAQVEIIISQIKSRVSSLVTTKRQCISDTVDEGELPPDLMRKEDEIDLIRQQAISCNYDADSLIKLHQSYQASLEQGHGTMSTAVWRPVSLEFKNMFGYGGSVVNKINFKRGTISVTANNGYGKTSIVNILLFALFGRTPLNPSPSPSGSYDIINGNETSGYVKILANHGGQYYLIERKTIRKNTKAGAVLALQKLNRYDFACSIWESNIRGEQLQVSTITTEELFGNIDDFLLSNLLNKESSLDLLSMTPTEQIKVLKKIFKLEVYDLYKDLNKVKLQELEKDITAIGIERKTLCPLVDQNLSDQQLATKELAVKAGYARLSELRDQQRILRDDHRNFTEAIREYQMAIKKVKTSDIPTGDALIHHQNRVKSYNDNTPLDTGVTLKVLQYRLDDLQRKVDTTKGEIAILSAVLSAVPCEANLLAQLLNYQEQLKQLPDPSISKWGVTDRQLNRKLGDLSGKINQLIARKELLTIPEPPELIEGSLPELRALHDQLTFHGDVGERLDEIDALLAGNFEVTDDDTDLEAELQKILHLEKACSELSLKIEKIEKIENDLNLDLKLEAERLLGMLYPDLPVSMIKTDSLEQAEERLKTLQGQMTTLCTFDQIISHLHHGNHSHTSNRSGCILSTEIVDDIINYLENGDKLRKLDQEITKAQAHYEKIQEQLQINEKIKHNNKINQALLVIEHKLKVGELQLLKTQYDIKKSQHDKYLLVQEYSQLCEVERQQYRRQELQYQIDYLEAIDRNNKLVDDLAILQEERETVEGLLLRLEVTQKITDINTDLEAHTKIVDYQRQLERYKTELLSIEDQIFQQELYESYLRVMELEGRIRIHEENLTIATDLANSKAELKTIESDLAEVEQQIIEQDNHVKELREQLSILQYRYQEQQNIIKKLEAADERLEQLERMIIPYQEYNTIMGNKGITSKLLYNKIKSIEDYINHITQKFTKYVIHITYDDKKQTIGMITENRVDGNYLSTARLCGFEKLILQIAFKRALNKFSYNSKSSIIIVDEAFDCIDQDNFLTKLPEAVSLITQDYSNCLAISQRDIAHISDHIITIRRDEAGCRIYQK